MLPGLLGCISSMHWSLEVLQKLRYALCRHMKDHSDIPAIAAILPAGRQVSLWCRARRPGRRSGLPRLRPCASRTGSATSGDRPCPPLGCSRDSVALALVVARKCGSVRGACHEDGAGDLRLRSLRGVGSPRPGEKRRPLGGAVRPIRRPAGVARSITRVLQSSFPRSQCGHRHRLRRRIQPLPRSPRQVQPAAPLA